MPLPFKPFDAILMTHIHYDHVGGIDDFAPLLGVSDKSGFMATTRRAGRYRM